MAKKVELLLENEPSYRQEHFAKRPEDFELKKEYVDILFQKLGANPNDMGNRLLPKYIANFQRQLEGKCPIPLTKEESAFVQKKVPFSWYLSFTKKMVEDERYQKGSAGIFVTHMDQKEHEDLWLKYRKGIFPMYSYVKAAPISPSSAGPIVNPEDAIYEGQSIRLMKREKQGLPLLGEKKPFDPGIAQRGHDAEWYLLDKAPSVIERVLGISGELYPATEAMYEHLILGDFLQGNMDGEFMNYETMKVEGIEIKTTGSMNYTQQEHYKQGLIPGGYLVQTSCYMAIRGFSHVNLVAGWGLDRNLDMTAIRINRSFSDEAYLLAKILWFSIEAVIKDGDISEQEALVDPEVLLKDTFTIYGQEVSKKRQSFSVNPDMQKAATEYKALLQERDFENQKAKQVMKRIDKKIAKCEQVLLDQAPFAEEIRVQQKNGKTDIFFSKTRKSKRFSAKLFDQAIAKYQKGDIDKDELIETITNRKNLETESQSRSIKYYQSVPTDR